MANLKNTSIDGTVFRLPAGDTSARPASPAATQLRFNTETGKLEQFRPGAGAWIAPSNSGVIATGGDAVYDVDVEGTTYRVHVFTSTGTSTFSVLQGGEVEYLIVAGGGGGGDHRSKTGTGTACGGGGGGGVLTGSLVITQSNYNVSVGNGGINPDGQTGVNGDDSSVFSFTAVGGGGGGARNSAANSGGSGGGVGYADNSGGSGTAGQGNKGGDSNNNTYAGTGGGGAGEPGVGFPSPTGATGTGTRGGNGLNLNITGTYNFYAGGGGGGDAESAGTSQGASGGLGGGGAGSGAGDLSVGPNNAQSGIENTGGGGGGAASDNTLGGDGGSGIVVIRYPLRQENPQTFYKQNTKGLILELDFSDPAVFNGSRSSKFRGTYTSDPVAEAPRTHRTGVEFGGSYYLNMNDRFVPITGDHTVLFLYKRTGGGRGGFFERNGNPPYNGIVVGQGGSNNWAYAVNSTSNSISVNFSYPASNEWYFDAGVFENGNTVRGYRNGSLVGTDTGTINALEDNTNSRLPLLVANRDLSTNLSITVGYVAIYSRALSQTEIQDIYTNKLSWRFGI